MSELIGITGATGHIGANLVRVFIQKGYKVRLLVRKDKRAISGLNCEFVEGDILDPVSLGKLIEGCDKVVHLAAYISIKKESDKIAAEINVQGTKNVISACFKYHVKRLIHLSSIHALSPFPEGKVVDETSPLVDKKYPVIYDRTKAQAQKEVRKAVSNGLNAVILNPTGVIGPYDFKPSLVGQMIISLVKGRFPALVKGGFNWVDVRDITEVTVRALNKGVEGECYILGGTWLSVKDLALLVAKYSAGSIPKIIMPVWLARIGVPFIGLYSRLKKKNPLYTRDSLYALRHHRYISYQKAINTFGYSPRPINQTIQDTVKWFYDNGYVQLN